MENWRQYSFQFSRFFTLFTGFHSKIFIRNSYYGKLCIDMKFEVTIFRKCNSCLICDTSDTTQKSKNRFYYRYSHYKIQQILQFSWSKYQFVLPLPIQNCFRKLLNDFLEEQPFFKSLSLFWSLNYNSVSFQPLWALVLNVSVVSSMS